MILQNVENSFISAILISEENTWKKELRTFNKLFEVEYVYFIMLANGKLQE